MYKSITEEILILILVVGLWFAIAFVLNIFIKSDWLKKKLSFKTYGYFIAVIIIGKLAGYMLATTEVQLKKGWTPLQEKQLKEGILKQIDAMGLSDESKQEFINCAMGKYKSAYPNGINDVSEGDAYNVGKRIGKECFESIDKVDMKWTVESEKMLVDYYMNSKDFKDFPIEKKQNFARCVVDQLKIMYPEGLTGKVSENVWNEIGKICVKNLE